MVVANLKLYIPKSVVSKEEINKYVSKNERKVGRMEVIKNVL